MARKAKQELTAVRTESESTSTTTEVVPMEAEVTEAVDLAAPEVPVEDGVIAYTVRENHCVIVEGRKFWSGQTVYLKPSRAKNFGYALKSYEPPPEPNRMLTRRAGFLRARI